MKIIVEDFIKTVPLEELESGIADIDFNGALMVRIEKVKDEDDENYAHWKITNAMNGYGQNCFQEYKDCEVSILP